MADIADDADRIIEQALADRIAAASRAQPVIAPCGHCLFCGATELPNGAVWPAAYRWCDTDCRDGHEQELKLRGGKFR